MKVTARTLGTLALGSALTLAVLFAARARAAGVPESEALTYTGYLEDAEGAPLKGVHSVAVRFWAAAEKGTAICSQELASAELASGRFQVPLPVECVDAVKSNPDLYVDVLVDGASLGRTKLGAVPYALEAGRAAVATGAEGALDKRLASLEAPGPTSAFLASNTSGTSLPANSTQAVIFDRESYDVGNEHNPITGVFAPKLAGLYEINCNIIFWNDPPSGPFFMEAGVFVNDVRRDVSAGRGDGYGQTYRAHAVLQLTAGDKVTCRAYQSSGKAVPLAPVRANEAVSTFGAFRISR